MPALDQIRRKVLEAVKHVPAGRLVTHRAISEHFQLSPRAVIQIFATLSDAEAQDVPWHRVVADGGAVGRHPRRDEQIARLKAEGVSVAPAGIAQELPVRAVRELADLGAPATPPAATGDVAQRPGRSRGMKQAIATPPKR